MKMEPNNGSVSVDMVVDRFTSLPYYELIDGFEGKLEFARFIHRKLRSQNCK